MLSGELFYNSVCWKLYNNILETKMNIFKITGLSFLAVTALLTGVVYSQASALDNGLDQIVKPKAFLAEQQIINPTMTLESEAMRVASIQKQDALNPVLEVAAK